MHYESKAEVNDGLQVKEHALQFEKKRILLNRKRKFELETVCTEHYTTKTFRVYGSLFLYVYNKLNYTIILASNNKNYEVQNLIKLIPLLIEHFFYYID